jgi:hypothetical protein
MAEQPDLQEKENELLSAYFMGDIREDIQYLGLTLSDIGWIVGNTLSGGGFLFLLPLPFWIKMPGLFLIFGMSVISRFFAWPYRRRRRYRFFRQKKAGLGEEMEQLLGVQSDGWFYRSGKTLHVVVALHAHPWQTAVFNQKRQRINGYEQFLRACASEGFEASLSAEQVADYQHELWAAKASKPVSSEGMAMLKNNRIAMWKQKAESGEARRSVYTLRLSVMEYRIDSRERDDEEAELSKAERHRFRMQAELREKLQRVLDPLTASGHTVMVLSGFAVPELIGRWWDPITWDQWKAAQGDWEEEVSGEMVISLAKDRDEEIEEETESIESEAIPRRRVFAALSAMLIVLAKKTGQGFRLFISVLKRLLKRLKRGRSQAKDQELIAFISAADLGEGLLTENEEVQQPSFLQGISFLVSPASTGKSFLAVNIAVANSREQAPINIVDLSPDRGTHTYLNPLKLTSAEECWEAFVSRNAPGATLWLPNTEERPDVGETIRFLRKLEQKGPVLVDLPFSHPAREELLKMGQAVAVVDTDYHHWLQWEQAASSWRGIVWLNQSEEPMTSHMITLLKEKWGLNASLTIPYFPEASRWLFQGRPFVCDPKVISYFVSAKEEKNQHDSSIKAVS